MIYGENAFSVDSNDVTLVQWRVIAQSPFSKMLHQLVMLRYLNITIWIRITEVNYSIFFIDYRMHNIYSSFMEVYFKMWYAFLYLTNF